MHGYDLPMWLDKSLKKFGSVEFVLGFIVNPLAFVLSVKDSRLQLKRMLKRGLLY